MTIARSPVTPPDRTPAPAEDDPDHGAPPLRVALDLFQRLEADGLRHCSFKSNPHLRAALAGETDIDLLVARADLHAAESALADLGYRQVRSGPWARFPGLTDWLGMDHDTGRLVHVHLHVRLLTGTRFVKEQHLPWEGPLLDTSVLDPRYGVRTSHPAAELVLLAIRAVLKTRRPTRRDHGRERSLLSASLRAELALLRPHAPLTGPLSVEHFATRLLPPAAATALLDALHQDTLGQPATLAALRRALAPALRPYQRLAPDLAPALHRLQRSRRFAGFAARKLNLTWPSPLPWNKRLLSGGVLIAVIGCDGAGKSTVTAELARWLGWKAEARTLYLGCGDGAVGLRVRLLRRLAGATEIPGSSEPKPASPKPTSPKPVTRMPTRVPVPRWLRDLGSGLLADAISAERHQRLQQAERLRAVGGILLTDRFPQRQFHGIYDGPRLIEHPDATLIRRHYTRRETQRYAQMAAHGPDLVIKLRVPADVAVARKPGHHPDTMARKVALTDALTFPDARVCVVDATQPLEDVVLACKRLVWAAL